MDLKPNKRASAGIKIRGRAHAFRYVICSPPPWLAAILISIILTQGNLARRRRIFFVQIHAHLATGRVSCVKYHHKKSRETWNLPRCRSTIDSILRLLLKSMRPNIEKNRKNQNFEKIPQKSRFRFFLKKIKLTKIFNLVKKIRGVKKIRP